jgi:hypothetical protein
MGLFLASANISPAAANVVSHGDVSQGMSPEARALHFSTGFWSF